MVMGIEKSVHCLLLLARSITDLFTVGLLCWGVGVRPSQQRKPTVNKVILRVITIIILLLLLQVPFIRF
jgi:hypothetical protein